MRGLLNWCSVLSSDTVRRGLRHPNDDSNQQYRRKRLAYPELIWYICINSHICWYTKNKIQLPHGHKAYRFRWIYSRKAENSTATLLHPGACEGRVMVLGEAGEEWRGGMVRERLLSSRSLLVSSFTWILCPKKTQVFCIPGDVAAVTYWQPVHKYVSLRSRSGTQCPYISHKLIFRAI